MKVQMVDLRERKSCETDLDHYLGSGRDQCTEATVVYIRSNTVWELAGCEGNGHHIEIPGTRQCP